MQKDIFSKIYILQKKGNSRKAISELLEASTGRIKKPYRQDINHAWYLIGDIYYNDNNFPKAIHAFKRALSSWPNDVDALWALANIHSERKKPWLAKHYLLKAIKIRKDSEELRYNLANAFFDLAEYREAIKLYKTITSSNKDLFLKASKNIEIAERLDSA